MTDAGEAFTRWRRLAAGKLMRKEELEAELLKLRRDRLSLDGIAASDEAEALQRDLDARIKTVAEELAGVDDEYREALAEMAALQKLSRDAEVAGARATVAAATAEADPILRSAEEIALDNVRAHVADLEGQLKAGKELKELEQDPPPPPTPGPGKRTM